MSSRTLDELLTCADRALLEAVLDTDETNFVQLGKMLNLNKKTAWQFLNLSGSDFSNCDLRGFNFTGADLRGCTGANIIIDATTVFDDAQVDASVFALSVATARIFADHPDLKKEYSRIKSAYWTDQHNWVVDALTKPARNAEVRRALATSLFFDTKDPVVRNTIMQFIVLQPGDMTARVGFLARFLSEKADEAETAIQMIRICGRFFRQNQHVLLLLMAFAENEQKPGPARWFALHTALGFSNAYRYLPRAWPLVQMWNDAELENRFIRALASQWGREFELVASGGRTSGGVNLRTAIDLEELLIIVGGIWSALEEEMAESHSKTTRWFSGVRSRNELVMPVVEILEAFNKRGVNIPLALDREELIEMYGSGHDG